MVSDADFLMLSGIKHFCFCRRRWALVHIEQQWQENPLTLSGHLMHERVHDENFTESRGSVLLSRGMPVCSQLLCITGECDLVELYLYTDDKFNKGALCIAVNNKKTGAEPVLCSLIRR